MNRSSSFTRVSLPDEVLYRYLHLDYLPTVVPSRGTATVCTALTRGSVPYRLRYGSVVQLEDCRSREVSQGQIKLKVPNLLMSTVEYPSLRIATNSYLQLLAHPTRYARL